MEVESAPSVNQPRDMSVIMDHVPTNGEYRSPSSQTDIYVATGILEDNEEYFNPKFTSTPLEERCDETNDGEYYFFL